VLLEHLARNHPLPDGNKRAAFLLTALPRCQRTDMGRRGHQRRRGMVERAAAGAADHGEIVSWIRARTS
jgi:prophage maintenance system killer protein